MPRCRFFCGAVVLLGMLNFAPVARGEFSLRDTPGDHLDVMLDGKVVARYMYAHDNSSKERRDETYKPYLHVFDADGKTPITKGPGGLFPHHRGIFIGWRQIEFNGRKYDRWHMIGGEIVHRKFANQHADANEATFTSMTDWNDEHGKPFLIEERKTVVRRAPQPARILIDFVSTLSAPRGEVVLGGDPEHAGIHYRPANELDTSKTLYYFPAEKPQPHKDVDYPWVGETYTLNGKQYSVVQMSHPTDPKNTKWSAYRDYGRFGAYPQATIPAGGSVTFSYRFLIADGAMPPAQMIEEVYDDFAGTKTEVPHVTQMQAEKSAPPKPAPRK